MRPLVQDAHHIRLAMLGMVEGNGHPYSWSAIINGRYDPLEMAACGFPVIPKYLGAQAPGALGTAGAQVTHVWCDRREDAERVARCAFVEHVADRPEDVIGEVDAVVVATDIGHEHGERVRPFVEAGLPVFVDKPLTDNEAGLRQFVQWHNKGCPLLSTSCMRYASEFFDLRSRMGEVGSPRLITVTMSKSWERYGIHAIEAVYGLVPSGAWESVTNSGSTERNVVHAIHSSGIDIVISVISDLYGAFGNVVVYGTHGRVEARFLDTFTAFKAQLEAFIDYLRTGRSPVPFEQTVEQIRILIAGLRSREKNGRRVNLAEIEI